MSLSDEQSNPELKKEQVSNFILKRLRTKGAIKEKDLILEVYLQYNELLSYSMLISLKARDLVEVNGGMWSIKQTINRKED